ncbi:MAG: hypothetical protein WD000_10425 [Thermodesulfobacteriota bacterium]
MTKLKRTLTFGLLLIVLGAICSLLIVMYITRLSDEPSKTFWIIYISSLLPTIVSGSIAAFLYHHLCESKKRWVHILWFLINLIIIVGFAPSITFVMLSSMLN